MPWHLVIERLGPCPFSERETYYSNQIATRLPVSTADTRVLRPDRTATAPDLAG